MIAIGLHITKCAGTSLASMARHQLPPEEYFFCSSFLESVRRSEPLFWEISEPWLLRLIFGHYVHESLIHFFGRGNVFLFTGLRDPIRRAVSDYSQMCYEERVAGRPMPTAEDYLDLHADTMCVELLRAFPTMADLNPEAPLHEQAAGVLNMFDCVYNSDAFEDTIQPVLQVLGLEGIKAERENVSRGEEDEFIQAQRARIVELGAARFANDIKLFERFAPSLGQVKDSTAPDGSAMPTWWDILPHLGPRGEAASRFSELLMRYMVAEFEVLGRLHDLGALAEQRISAWTGILARANEMLAAGQAPSGD